MPSAEVARGREFSPALLDRIRRRIASDDDLTRTALSREVCEWSQWRSPNGQLQEMGCRLALLELERRGLLELPPPRAVAWLEGADPPDAPLDTHEVSCALEDLGAIELVAVTAADRDRSSLWNTMIARHHYLGTTPLVGAQQRYLVETELGVLGALGFSAAAWRVRARDTWIGWSDAARQAHLAKVVCNSRFLLLPWVTVPNLASRVLSLAARRLARDWKARYGYEPVLLETYVDGGRFDGTSYRAANWVCVGETSGRGRQDRTHARAGTPKQVYVYPLTRRWRRRLGVEVSPAEGQPPAGWAEREFGAAELGDRRLRDRLITIAEDFYARPQANIPQACNGDRAKTKAVYRFLDHKDVSMEVVLDSHRQQTVERMGKHPVVLAVQDTTSLNYTRHPDTEGLGSIGTRSGGAQGLIVHDTVVFTPEGLSVGVLDAQVWARDEEEALTEQERRQRPIEQKESAKWLRSYEAAASAQAEVPGTRVVSVGDREADLYELFALARDREGGPDLLVRAESNRRLLASEDEAEHLRSTLEAQPIAGYQEVEVPRRPGRRARMATLTVRFAAVTLRPPRGKARLGPVRVCAVLAREEEAPATGERLEWMLLTTLEVSTLAEAVEKLKWYAQRWQIEVFHRVIKSGCRMEDRQLGSATRLESCLAIDLVVAWRLLHLTRLGRESPDVPCTIYFEDYQWEALYVFIHHKPPPSEPLSLRTAIRMVAGLGGFLGRKCDGEPGTQTLWRGLQRLDDIGMGALAYRQAYPERIRGP